MPAFEHWCAAHASAAGFDEDDWQAENVFGLPGAEKHYPPSLELEPVHLALDLHVDIARRTCSGTATHTVRARRSGPSELRLHAVACEITQVRDPDGRALSWTYDGRELAILWQEAFNRDEQRPVEVAYRVTRPTAGLYFSQPTEAYPEQPWFAATDSETGSYSLPPRGGGWGRGAFLGPWEQTSKFIGCARGNHPLPSPPPSEGEGYSSAGRNLWPSQTPCCTLVRSMFYFEPSRVEE